MDTFIENYEIEILLENVEFVYIRTNVVDRSHLSGK